MEKEILRINILCITLSGLLMLGMGLGLYLLKSQVSPLIRFFLPIPPIGVAAYIFVFNLFKHYNGALPDRRWDVVLEIAISTLVSSILYGLFTLLLVLIIGLLVRHP